MASPENFTNTDEDPFGDLNDHGMRNLAATPYLILDYLVPIFMVIKLSLYILSIASDLFLIYIIHYRFKRLKTKINEYIMHYCITNVAFFVFVILQIFIKRWGYDLMVFCVVFEMDDACLFMSFVMINMLAVDWFITSFKPEVTPKYEKWQEYLILGIYLAGVVKFFITGSTCFISDILVIRYNLLNFLFFIMFLGNAILLVMRCFENIPNTPLKRGYTLYVSSFILFSWLPSFVYHYLIIIFIDNETASLVLFYVKIFTEILAYSCSFSLVFLLRRLSVDFRTAIHAFFEGTTLDEDRDNLNDNFVDEHNRIC